MADAFFIGFFLHLSHSINKFHTFVEIDRKYNE